MKALAKGESMKIHVKVDVDIRDEMSNPSKACHIDLELETKHSECEALDDTFGQITRMLKDILHG